MTKTTSNVGWIKLLAALRFISVAQRAVGSDMERHCMLYAGYATAFNGTIAAGMPIDIDMNCNPHTVKLIAALENCSTGYNVAALDDRIIITSGIFGAAVPVIETEKLQWAMPDPMTVIVNNDLSSALIAVMDVTNDKSDRVHESAVLMQSRTCLATDGDTLLESWHGWDLPPNILLPKAAPKALNKARKTLIGLGYGNTTVTFHFSDHSWIRSQRYLTEWPHSTLLNTQTTPRKLSPTLFTAWQRLGSFSEDGNFYCWNGKARSHPFSQQNAFSGQLSADVEGFTSSRVYHLRSLASIHDWATMIDDITVPRRTFVYGTKAVKLGTKKSDVAHVKMRGVFAHASEEAEDIRESDVELWQRNMPRVDTLTDDDIPF